MLRILIVNPSFGSDTERDFWDLIAQGCVSGDLHVHSFAMRKVNQPDAFNTETHSARLVDYGRNGGRDLLDQLRIRRAPSWWPLHMSELQVDWERRRWPGELDQMYALRGVHLLASVADDVLDRVKPDLVLTTNKIDHPCVIFRKAAQARSIPTALVERSPFSGIWLEPNGLFAESEIPQAWADATPTTEHRELGQDLLEYLRQEPATFRSEEDKPVSQSDMAAQDQATTLLLLIDNALWTGWAQPGHPQRTVDYPYLDGSPQHAINRIAALAADRGMQVLIRPHPSCRDQLSWQLPANTTMSESDLGTDLSVATAVVAFNTKVTFPAAAFGLPVATLAPNPIEASGYSHIVRSDDELKGFLDAVECGDDLATEHDLSGFVGWLAADFMVGEQGVATPTTTNDVVTRLRSLAAADGPLVEPPVQAGQPHRGPKLNIVEVTRLQNKKLRYSGIAVAQRSLARELARLPKSSTYFLIESHVGASGHDVDVRGVAELCTTTNGRVLVTNPTDRNRLLETLTAQDVYHSTHRELPPSKLTGQAKRALTVHDVIHEYRPDLDELPGVPYITHLLNRSDQVTRFLCDSDQTRRDLIRARSLGPGATCVVELGTEAQPNCPPGRFTVAPYVLVLAQGSQRKNMPHIAQALNLLAEDHELPTELAFVIAGGDSAVHVVVEHLSASATARVQVKGEPSQAELGQLFRDAELCLFGSEFEGFGLIPLEAMAYGSPVVTPWNSSLGEVCGSAVEYTLSTSPDDLYRATRNVLLVPQLQAQLRDAGLRRAEAYSWKASALAHLAVYDDLRAAEL